MAICFMESEILEPVNSENEVRKQNSDSFEGKRISENQFRMGKHKEMGNGKCAMMREGWPCRSGTCRYDRGCITCVWVLSLDLHLQSIGFRAISRSFIFL